MLAVRDLKVHWPAGGVGRKKRVIPAVDGVSFILPPGETLGVVGESGCGKSSLARALVRLAPCTSGEILWKDLRISALSPRAFRPLRREIQMIFQDPTGSLDPRMTAAESIAEALAAHHLASGRKERRNRTIQLLEAVGLDASQANQYPRQLSGGQRQRLGIARALAVEPSLIICDEPVSALDVSVQAQIVNLLRDLQEEDGLAYLFIAHDLAVVENISQRIMVLYLGKVVEIGEASDVTQMPRHPYTQALVAAVPKIDAKTGSRKLALTGEIPSRLNPPTGCPFHPRCPGADLRCRIEPPLMRQLASDHWVSCHLAK